MAMNLTDKAAFFAQYESTYVIANKCSGKWVNLWPFGGLMFFSDSYVAELKPLSNIAEDELIQIARLWRVDANTDGKVIIESFTGMLERLPVCIADFLRSRGYLIPFRNYSTDQIIEMGWAKLKVS